MQVILELSEILSTSSIFREESIDVENNKVDNLEKPIMTDLQKGDDSDSEDGLSGWEAVSMHVILDSINIISNRYFGSKFSSLSMSSAWGTLFIYRSL